MCSGRASRPAVVPGQAAVRQKPPQKARAFGVRPDMSPEEAVRGIVRMAYQHLRANEAGVLQSENPEYVHQMRVAVRRLRSALRMFPHTNACDLRSRCDAALRTLGRALGGVRDLDVFGQTVEPALRDLPRPQARAVRAAIAGRVGSARARAREYLQTPDYERLTTRLALWLAMQAPDAGGGVLMHLARRQLARLYKHVARGAARLDSLDESGRHRLRVQIKRARYAAEFFSGLYARDAVRPYVAALSELQDCLGSLTDINMARALLRDFELGCEIEQRLLGAWEARASDAAQTLESGFEAATRCAGFWKRHHGRRTHV